MNPDISDAEQAFSALASGLRLQILERLSETPDAHRSFSDLYQAVEAKNTSQFSYHLAELTPHFVQETSDGYAIRDAGRRIVESVKSGAQTVTPAFDRVDLTTHCPNCGETAASATYDGRFATVDCQSCSKTLMRYELRPAHVANRSSYEALVAADRQMRAEYESALDGVCQRCGGTVSVDLHTELAATGATAIVACECDQCGTEYDAPVEVALLTHPPVITQLGEDGVDVRNRPIWRILPALEAWDVEVQRSNAVTVDISNMKRLRVEVRDDVHIQPSA